MINRPPPPSPLRPAGPSLLGRVLAVLCAIIVIGLGVMAWPAVHAFSDVTAAALLDWRAQVGAAVLLFLGALMVAVVRAAFAWAQKVAHHADQAAVVKLANNMPAHIKDLRDGQLIAQLLARSLDQHYAAKLAEAERPMPQLHSFHQAVHHTPAAQQALLAPPPIALTAEAEWLSWTDQTPHLMVAGRTDSGKTTTVEAVLARRITAGDLVLVIDPHYQAGKWLGATAIGGGRDYQACYQAFDAIRALLDKRYVSFNAGTRTEDFKRITIIVDEVPAIIAHAQMTSKALYERWLLFATSLGSEARKVRISIVLLTQSPLVRDIGISSAMRENFTRIALGDTAMDLLREDPDPARKQALLELLRGRPYAAAMEYHNNWYALKNDAIRDLARTNGMVPRAPSLLLAPALPTSQSIPPTARVGPPVAQPVPPTMQIQITNAEQILDLLSARSGQWMTTSEIAAALRLDRQVAATEISELSSTGQLASRRCKGRTTKERLEYTINASTYKSINALSA